VPVVRLRTIGEVERHYRPAPLDADDSVWGETIAAELSKVAIPA